MYDIKPNLTIGSHGCEAAVRDQLLHHPNEIKISKKPFDWLGNGMYFRENNYERAVQWAQEKKDRGLIKEPAVIGAVLYLGYCCDFLNKKHLGLLATYYSGMKIHYQKAGNELPINQDLPNDPFKNKILRYLDCAAIEFMHAKTLKQVEEETRNHGHSPNNIFDTFRGVFTEGGPAFEGAAIFAKSHIQICVRNPNSIQGFFMPREEIDFLLWLKLNKTCENQQGTALKPQCLPSTLKKMSEKDFKWLMEIAERTLKEDVTKEQAIRSLMDAGIVDATGKLVEPYTCLAAILSS